VKDGLRRCWTAAAALRGRDMVRASLEKIEGLASEWVEKLVQQKGVDVAKEAHGVIFNTVHPLSPNIESWAASITHRDAETQSLHLLAVTTLCNYFKTAAKITEEGLEEFLSYL
jgi:hypothetical protein